MSLDELQYGTFSLRGGQRTAIFACNCDCIVYVTITLIGAGVPGKSRLEIRTKGFKTTISNEAGGDNSTTGAIVAKKGSVLEVHALGSKDSLIAGNYSIKIKPIEEKSRTL